MTTPFQCDVSHFRIIYLRDPDPQALVEVETMEFSMRQAVLDSFWSREPTTVRGNLQEAKRGLRSVRRFAFPGDSVTLPMGPVPLSDNLGMKAALVVLDRSLDAGRYSDLPTVGDLSKG
jgi:hypothetical protein